MYVLPHPTQGLLDSFKSTVVGVDFDWGRSRDELNKAINGIGYTNFQRYPKGDPYVTDVTIEY